jgi:hypothetical protein
MEIWKSFTRLQLIPSDYRQIHDADIFYKLDDLI